MEENQKAVNRMANQIKDNAEFMNHPPILTPKEQPKLDWRSELYDYAQTRRLHVVLNDEGGWVEGKLDVLADFISQVAQKERETMREEFLEILGGMKKDPEISWRNKPATAGYNDAIEEVKDKVRGM